MKPVSNGKEKCCNEIEGTCIALIKKDCVGCAFYKSVEQREQDNLKTMQRLRKLRYKK